MVDGQRFSFFSCQKGSGLKEDNVLKNTGEIFAYVCRSVRPSIYPSRALTCLAGWEGRGDGRMDRRTHIFPLYSTGHRPLWVRCPKGMKRVLAISFCSVSCVFEKKAMDPRPEIFS